MDRFTLQLSPAAVRDLDRLEERAGRKILEKLTLLKDDPFPRGKLIRKIKGKRSTFYRLRIESYRAFYMIEGRDVVILKIIDKKDAERFIKDL